MSEPRRIVSLVPSLTHMLCDFGLRAELSGVTHFCIEPPGLARQAALIGGTKDPDIAKIAALRPTHILVNVEENKPEHIAACQELAPTYVCFPKSPQEVPAMLREVAQWLGTFEVGARFAGKLEETLHALAERVPAGENRRYLYLIWREPYMLAGEDSYIAAMLALLGWENVAPAGARYPEITVDAMRACAPDLLLLSSEPYPFRRRDAARLREAWPEAPQMLKVDGQLCSWYGTMTADAVEALAAWLDGKQTKVFEEFRD